MASMIINLSMSDKSVSWHCLVYKTLLSPDGVFLNSQCCSCLFVSGRTVVYRIHYKRPQFPRKIDFGGPNYRLQRLMLRLLLTLLTVRPARQDGVYLRRMTTTALSIAYSLDLFVTVWWMHMYLLQNCSTS